MAFRNPEHQSIFLAHQAADLQALPRAGANPAREPQSQAPTDCFIKRELTRQLIELIREIEVIAIGCNPYA